MNYPNASIVIPTLNNVNTLKKVVKEMLKQDYPAGFEIIIVNDGSTDLTKKMLQENFSSNKKISIINFSKNQGVCKARNAGIKIAKHEIIINMDHDCLPEKNWLKEMVKGFEDPQVGVVTAYPPYGGTSTGFLKKALKKVGGGYDEDYFYYREDSDLTLKIMEAGYKLKVVNAKYFHDHEEVKPQGILKILKYAWKRINYHQNDVLLFKKHPVNPLVKEFLHIKFGFIVNPLNDFQTVTGTWHSGGKLNVSSPRGITFLENKTFLHTLLIFLIATTYVFVIKLVRLYASIRFGKLLI